VLPKQELGNEDKNILLSKSTRKPDEPKIFLNVGLLAHSSPHGSVPERAVTTHTEVQSKNYKALS